MDKTHYKQKQSGVVLVISLIMLILLTLLGITAMRTTTLEEKMAGNDKDRNIAFQAAEAALRDAENNIETLRASKVLKGKTGLNADCSPNGICDVDDGAALTDIFDGSAAMLANAAAYGSATSATSLTKVAAQPEYLIQAKRIEIPGVEGWQDIYVNIAIGKGGQATTESILESTYRPNN